MYSIWTREVEFDENGNVVDNSSVTSVTRKANKKKRDDSKIGDDNKRHRPS